VRGGGIRGEEGIGRGGGSGGEGGRGGEGGGEREASGSNMSARQHALMLALHNARHANAHERGEGGGMHHGKEYRRSSQRARVIRQQTWAKQ